MSNAAIILVIGVLYACIITPWYHGLWIGMMVALISCALVDFAAWAIRKIFTNR